jgi:NAD(P)-dependent dehydrogenase (short-subunit alcohol dehydrogenase family)
MKADKKNALVTGGAVRIGRGLSLMLADLGFGVVVHYGRSEREARALVEQIGASGGRAWALQADLSDEKECASLTDRAASEAGPLSVLINNAAVFDRDALRSVDWDTAIRQFRINLLAPLTLSGAFVDASESGKIIHMLDRRIHAFDEGHVSYVLAKKALAECVMGMARAFAPRFTVNGVAPGPVLPPPGEGEDYLAEKAGRVPLERPCNVEQVAAAVLFLLQSDTITGQVLYVDGGQHLLSEEELQGGRAV